MTALGLRPHFRAGLSPRTVTAFSPARLSGLAFWYDAARSPIVAAGGAVERWDDISGNDNHAGQASSGQRPTKTTDGEGRPLVSFDGVDDALLVAAPPDLSAGVTVFVAYRIRTPADFRRIVAAGAADSTDNADFFAFQNEFAADKEIQLFRNATEPAIVKGVDSGELQFAIFTFDDDSVRLRDLNGEVSDGNTSTPFGTPAAVSLGAGLNNGATFSYGAVDLYEVGLYNRVLSDAELDQLEAYLKTRRGLAWNPLHIGADLGWLHDVVDGPFTLDGSSVDQWDDRSGNGRHWSQSGGARPEKTVDATGRDVVRFDGIDDIMAMSGTLPALEPFTCAIVYAVRNRVDFEGILSATNASGPDHEQFWTFQNSTAASGDMQLFGRSTEDGAEELMVTRPDGGGAQIAIWSVSGGNAELRDQAGFESDAYGGGFGTPAEIYLGGRYNGAPALFAEVDVYATVGVARELSAEDKQKLIDWAVIRWGL